MAQSFCNGAVHSPSPFLLQQIATLKYKFLPIPHKYCAQKSRMRPLHFSPGSALQYDILQSVSVLIYIMCYARKYSVSGLIFGLSTRVHLNYSVLPVPHIPSRVAILTALFFVKTVKKFVRPGIFSFCSLFHLLVS